MSCKNPWHGAVASLDDEEPQPLPSAEALLAATLALMTGVVERAALALPLAAHGQSLLMASKVRGNLRGLVGHPQLSPCFRATLERLSGHWERLLAGGDPWPPAEAAVRHGAPGRLQ